MQSVELAQDGLEIKFYATNSEHSNEYGLKSVKPLFFKYLFVEVNKRNRGNGTQLLKMIDEYAEKNNYDLIFGRIPISAEFTKDNRISLFSDIEMIKNWLHKNGYSINTMNDDFYKSIKKEKPLKSFNGIGFNNCLELGKYEVTTEIKIKSFTKLSEAKLFYDESKGEKHIWDLVKNELVDAFYYK
jgi:GNAT superfamily N-acetyltransferase